MKYFVNFNTFLSTTYCWNLTVILMMFHMMRRQDCMWLSTWRIFFQTHLYSCLLLDQRLCSPITWAPLIIVCGVLTIYVSNSQQSFQNSKWDEKRSKSKYVAPHLHGSTTFHKLTVMRGSGLLNLQRCTANPSNDA